MATKNSLTDGFPYVGVAWTIQSTVVPDRWKMIPTVMGENIVGVKTLGIMGEKILDVKTL